MQMASGMRGPAKSKTAAEGEMARVLDCQQALGTREFYVRPAEMVQLLRKALVGLPRPVLSLNRPHVDGKTVVHRVEWRGMVFTCVSGRPLIVG